MNPRASGAVRDGLPSRPALASGLLTSAPVYLSRYAVWIAS
jgi:hypothetical protein